VITILNLPRKKNTKEPLFFEVPFLGDENII
jgi:hypothetical protein